MAKKQDMIHVYGAKENNLKSIDISIPKNELVVITGISGSGKSTLAFSTLYAEGQRRYIESLSSYARQFLGRVGKPDVDKIEGLTPAIAIDQKTTSKNPRSTVGTITEIYDYLRLLFARVGKQYCHQCGKPISSMSAADIIEEVLRFPEGSKLVIMAPLVKEKKGTFADMLESLRHKGYVRAMIDGVMVRLDDEIELSKTKKHTIKVVIDRVVVKEESRDRIGQDVEKALKESYGEMEIEVLNHEELGLDRKDYHYSEHLACFDCKISFEPLEPVSFSFNSPKGACPACDGLGIRYAIDLKKVIDPDLSIEKGAVKIMYGFNKSYYTKFLNAFCEQNGIDIKKPYGELESHEQKAILYGNGGTVDFTWKRHKLKREWPGVVKFAHDMFKDEKDMSEYMTEKVCDKCHGHRLRPRSLAVKIEGHNIADIIDMPIEESYAYFADGKNFSHLTEQQQQIAESILKEIKERLYFLYDVGLGYITLSRDARTISGGEAQRIRIASQIGSGLTGVMYVLDEPSIGLHERDTMKLIRTLNSLKEKGNSVIVVEHDKETIMAADYIVDIGPGAGAFGGEVVFAGDQKKLLKAKTLTAQYLNGKKEISYPHDRPQKEWIEIKHVTLNNIENLDAKIPLHNFVCVTGVSGSGKSSLVDEIVRRFLNDFPDKTLAIISVDPSKRKSGGALLGDRIRMNSIDDPRVYMRSLATRQSTLSISKYVKDAETIAQAAGFDLIILETSGIGQSDTAIVDHSDISLYVMTPDYGAASQLEKIDMLDYADLISLNKFDKRGALDALRDVKKQFQRNHQRFEQDIDEMPVFGTIASQVNDPGVNELYSHIFLKINEKTGINFLSKIKAPELNTEKIHSIPPNRVRYLSEISDTVRGYNHWVEQQSDIARRLFSLKQSMEEMENTGEEESAKQLKAAYERLLLEIDPKN
ncbi:MAG: excinuclease ABC subunit UvrA, partial [Sulfurovum sp.]|nr:excinuclease ABC subunit UvrA [Sulfurovum sp.]